jgi:hypothetical protein
MYALLCAFFMFSWEEVSQSVLTVY